MADKGKKHRRIWSYGSNTVVSAVIFTAILVIVALIAEKHPWRMDLTEAGSYTLSEQTRNILKGIDKPVEIKAFFQTASPEEAKARDLLDTFKYYDKNINYEFIDPDRQPEEARRYDIRTYGTIVIEGYGKKQTSQTADEQSITNSLFKLTHGEEKKIYFIQGHGEHSVNNLERDGLSEVRSSLQKENYKVEELNLLQKSEVPSDAAVVIDAGPRKNLMKEEISTLKAYLDRGGKLMVFLDPLYDGGLRDFLKAYGIQLKDDEIIDKLSRLFGGSYLMPVVMQYGQHKITENFNIATFYPEARSVTPVPQPPEGVHVEILASTSPNAWSETNLELLKQGQASFDEKEDTPGPVPIVVISEMASKPAEKGNDSASTAQKPEHKGGKAGLLVAGDSDFVDNTNFSLSGNGDFFLNMLNYLAEEESLITIQPHEKSGRPLMMTQGQLQMLFWISIVMIPLIVALAGVGVYRVRRTQR